MKLDNSSHSLKLTLVMCYMLAIALFPATQVKAQQKYLVTDNYQHQSMLNRFNNIIGTWTISLGKDAYLNLIIEKNSITERKKLSKDTQREKRVGVYQFGWIENSFGNEYYIKTFYSDGTSNEFRIDDNGVYGWDYSPFKKVRSNGSKINTPQKQKVTNKPKSNNTHPIGLNNYLTHHLEGYMIIDKRTKNFITLDFACNYGLISNDVIYSYPSGNGGTGSTFLMSCTEFNSQKSKITFFGKDDQGSDFTLDLKYDKQGNFTGTANVGKYKGLKVELKATCKHD